MSDEVTIQPKRKPGRPKGAKDKKPRKPMDYAVRNLVDPKTGVVIGNVGNMERAVGRLGDEKVTAFVEYHMEMLKMRQGANLKDVPDLYNRFYHYLAYCAQKGIMPGNMSAYFAIGVSRQTIEQWKHGKYGTPEQHQFANDIAGFFASVHEQGAMENMFNPILGIFWQKSHDGMIEAQKLEVVQNDPLGEKQSAEDIMKKYEGVDLPT